MVGASKLRTAARKIGLFPCASFSKRHEQPPEDPPLQNVSSNAVISSAKLGVNVSEDAESSSHAKNLCAICLEPLVYGVGASSGQAIFTAQCSHAFHFVCISSNVRHGSVTCPTCRAYWTQLPRNLSPAPPSLPCSQTDPILRILDDSIATIRVHRRSSLRLARYDDDDPVEPDPTPVHPRLRLSFVPIPVDHPSFHPCGHPSIHVSRPATLPTHQGLYPRGCSPVHHFTNSSSILQAVSTAPSAQEVPSLHANRAYLSMKLAQQQATDLILVASTNGPHLRLLKQSMALVVFYLRSVDRLAIVVYSSAATRAFPLRCMTSHGKRTALQVVDGLFYSGEADPSEGLRKGAKILQDRTHQNPHSCILHLSDCPTRASYIIREMQSPFPVHSFHVGFGFGSSSGFVIHEFEEFLTRLLGGVIKDTQLRIGGGLVRLGELRGGEEKRIAIELDDCGYLCVGYSYIDGDSEECVRTGEIVVGVGDKSEQNDDGSEVAGRDFITGGRTSCGERWDFHDPYMARRWAKHLHGYRL